MWTIPPYLSFELNEILLKFIAVLFLSYICIYYCATLWFNQFVYRLFVLFSFFSLFDHGVENIIVFWFYRRFFFSFRSCYSDVFFLAQINSLTFFLFFE